MVTELRRCGGFDIPSAPPVMQLRYTTYTRTADFVYVTNPEFRPVARQNPPVLLPLETVCSARKHPLSSVSGRRRYNTLDLCTAKSCANRVLSPLLETPK